MLVAAGQPLLTSDTWWQLALGRFFRADGPWLDDDPLLFAAAGPVPTTSWLWNVAVSEILAATGFAGLRLFHVLLVVAILGLGWRLLRRASGSPTLASLGIIVFVALAAYRLVQLRPHLFSMLALLALYRLLVEHGRPPGARRIGLAAGLGALWANLHAAFPLGLILIGAAAAGPALAAAGSGAGREKRLRARQLATAFALFGLATWMNPSGPAAYGPYLAAGVETPDLEGVLDEWRSSAPWRLPIVGLPPSPLAWTLLWLQLLGLAWVLQRRLRGRRPGGAPGDPALLAVSLACVGLQLWAVRFLWLGIFPLLLVAGGARGLGRSRSAGPAAAAAALLLVAGFLRWGDWPMITPGLPTTWDGYRRPYAVHNYPTRAIWMLRDAGLAGRLYTEYAHGGFAGYWLSPRIRTLLNGSLHYPPDVALAMYAIHERRGVLPGESFPELLDRLGLDLFVGVRAPVWSYPRPWASTTGYLEGTPGWIPVLRTVTVAVYLRMNEENRANLERVARYYEQQGVPFDPERGFDVAEVLRRAPGWAVAHGVVPRGFVRLEHAARAASGPARVASRDRLAALYAALGLYARSIELDRETLEAAPDRVRARRRLVWALLRLHHFEEARGEAEPLAEQPQADLLAHRIAETARSIDAHDAAEADALIAQLPFLYRPELPWLTAGIVVPPVRPPRLEPLSRESVDPPGAGSAGIER